MFDWVVRYKHIDQPPTPGMTIEELRKAGYLLTEKQWLDVSFYTTAAAILLKVFLAHLVSGKHSRGSWYGSGDSPSPYQSSVDGK